ncbi:hypothetical protein DPMN_076759 [Dreissena polymorpha]|uniref:Uncharacterized protein n=1 Tax=Dreissena polymorpha TaxID=45954 RepID=A0A9D4BNN8_DREPO|nr:hypothetical protein DPMN_076759 [Dreissena polymorpha]
MKEARRLGKRAYLAYDTLYIDGTPLENALGEQQAIATSPITCDPKLWKRYVDDILEIVRKGHVNQLTEHLNTVDTTGSIKNTNEEKAEGKIPFLNSLIVRKED